MSVDLNEDKGPAMEDDIENEKEMTKDPLFQEPSVEVEKKVGLEKRVGLVGGVALIVGTIIGSGIFASPRYVLDNSGQSVGLSLFVWSLCGLLTISASLSYTELGTMIRKSGGEYAYLKEAYGSYVAFLYGWTTIIVSKPAQLAAVCFVFGSYTIEPFFPGCTDREDLQPVVKLLAALAIGIITFVNCASVKWATRMQIFFTAAKLLAIFILIVTGLVRLGQGYTSSFENSFSGKNIAIGGVGLAFYNGLWAYDGWNNLNYAVEELRNPNRDLPRAILIGIPLVTVCYVLVNIAYFSVLSSAEILVSGAVAVTLADRLYGVMAWIIPVFVACSTFGAANGVAFGSARLVFAAARDNQLPKLLAMIHTQRHTPLMAMLFNSFIALLMLIPESSSFSTLVNYFSFAAWLFYGITISCVIFLRFRKPELNRPYKVWIFVPILVLAAAVYLVIAPFYNFPEESAYCLLFIMAGTPFWLVFVYWKKVPGWFQRAFDKFTYKASLLFDVAFPEGEDDSMELN